MTCASYANVTGYACTDGYCSADSSGAGTGARGGCGTDICSKNGNPSPLCSPLSCRSGNFSQCAREAAAKCDAFPGCSSFGLSIAYWKGHGVVGKYFTSGRSSYSRDSGWQMWTREHQSEKGEEA